MPAKAGIHAFTSHHPNPIKKAAQPARPLNPNNGAESESLALNPLALHLARPSHRLSRFPRPALGWLLIMPAQFHLAEHALTLELLFKRLQRLIDVVITNKNLHLAQNSQKRSKSRKAHSHQAVCADWRPYTTIFALAKSFLLGHLCSHGNPQTRPHGSPGPARPSPTGRRPHHPGNPPPPGRHGRHPRRCRRRRPRRPADSSLAPPLHLSCARNPRRRERKYPVNSNLQPHHHPALGRARARLGRLPLHPRPPRRHPPLHPHFPQVSQPASSNTKPTIWTACSTPCA